MKLLWTHLHRHTNQAVSKGKTLANDVASRVLQRSSFHSSLGG